MERTHITIKGDVHQKSTEQAGEGEDSHARRNQIAAGYEIRDEEGYESREF
jgi:hypothetical protein